MKCENIILMNENSFIFNFIHRFIKLPKFFKRLFYCLTNFETINALLEPFKKNVEDLVESTINKVSQMSIPAFLLSLTLKTGKSIFLAGKILISLFNTLKFALNKNKPKYNRQAGKTYGLLFKLLLTGLEERKFKK